MWDEGHSLVIGRTKDKTMIVLTPAMVAVAVACAEVAGLVMVGVFTRCWTAIPGDWMRSRVRGAMVSLKQCRVSE